MNASKFFTQAEKDEILSAIRVAESETSGEIRVHVETHCKVEVLDRAAYIFDKLGMQKTALRNGVLFYLAISDHKFAILGDVGINRKVPEDFWNNISSRLSELFRQGKFTQGLSEGILMAGEQLKQHFPHQDDDINELSDEISFQKL
jgi:uncharacterized membrane protein